MMTNQDPQELLKSKHKLDEQKRQFTNFARSASGHGEAEAYYNSVMTECQMIKTA